MDEQTDTREDTYRQLYLACYDYHFGKITFLEMLRRWQEILQLPQPSQDQAQQEKSCTTVP
jgi:hypothetical protein